MRTKNLADSKRIKSAVANSPYSQRDIALLLSVSDITVSNWVSGWRKPSPENLANLAYVLGVEVTDLLTDA